MLENPRIPHYSCDFGGSDNVTGADNQQERLAIRARILRDYMPNTESDAFVKI